LNRNPKLREISSIIFTKTGMGALNKGYYDSCNQYLKEALDL